MVKSNKALFDDVGPSHHLFIIERNWSSDIMSFEDGVVGCARWLVPIWVIS